MLRNFIWLPTKFTPPPEKKRIDLFNCLHYFYDSIWKHVFNIRIILPGSCSFLFNKTELLKCGQVHVSNKGMPTCFTKRFG